MSRKVPQEKVERKALSTIDFESAKADMEYKNEVVYLVRYSH